MSILNRDEQLVKAAADFELDTDDTPVWCWDAWTDADVWELGPDPADAAWAALEFAGDDDDLDAMAIDSAAQDSCDRGYPGLIPTGLAESISRSSLVGLADEQADAFADESERISGSRPSRQQAAADVSLLWFRHGCGR